MVWRFGPIFRRSMALVVWLGVAMATSLVSAQDAAPRSDAFEQLEALVEQAGSRQLGQPGNDYVDRLVREKFERVVAEENARFGPDRVEAARSAIASADERDKAFTAERDQLKAYDEAAEALISPFYIRMLFEEPGMLIACLIVLAAIFALVGKVQKRRRLYVAAVVSVLFALAGYIAAARVVTEAERLAKGRPQSSGTSGDIRADQLFEAAKVAYDADIKMGNALEGMWQTDRLEWLTVAFVPGEAWINVGDRRSRVYAMAPNLVEPANLPEEGLTGPLVYVGDGGPTSLSGQKLDGAIIVIEFNSGQRWLNAVQLGAKAVLVLEPPSGGEMTYTEASQKMSNSPLSIPRFFVRRSDMGEVLGDDWREALDTRPSVTLSQKPSRWERRTVAADWLFIPGSTPPTGEANDPSRQLIHLQAYKDSQSIVPELSPGAGSAANLILLFRMVDHFRQHPPSRPVLISVVNDHTNALLGEQHFGFASFASSKAVLDELNELELQLARARLIVEVHENGPSHDLIEKMRDWTPVVAGRNVEIKDPIKDRLTQLRNEQRAEYNRLTFKIIEDGKLPESERTLSVEQVEQIKELRHQLTSEAQQINSCLKLFNRIGAKMTLGELTPEQRAVLDDSFRYVHDEALRHIHFLERYREALLRNMRMRRQLNRLTRREQDTPPTSAVEVQQLRLRPLPALAAITLDLNFGSDQLGFFYWDNMGGDTEEANAKARTDRLAQVTVRLANAYASRNQQPQSLVDTIRGAGGLPWSAHLGTRVALAAKPLHAYMVPALTLTSVRDMRPLEFTPHDLPSRINRANFDAIMSFAEGYLPTLISAPELALTTRTVGSATPLSAELRLLKVDEFTVAVPKLDLPDSLLVVQPTGQSLLNNASMFGQVRPWAALMTDGRAAALIRGSMWRGAGVSVYQYDPDYRFIKHASDMGDGQKRFSSVLSAAKTVQYITGSIVGVELTKVDLYGLSEPLQLTPVSSVQIIDALQESVPRHFSTAGVGSAGGATYALPLSKDGTASIFLQPDTKFKIRAGAGLAINSDPEHLQGVGFPSDVGRLSNLVLRSAQDMWLLTDGRLKLLEEKGVKNDTATFFNAQASERIAAAVAAEEAGRNDQVMINAEQAQGLAYQAYTRALSTINDLIKAVVIFLALVIPFCVFVTKLISPYTDVNRNLVFFGIVFVLMAILLRFVHPAFEIAKTPEVVILAFVIIGLAGFVASILIGRFNSLMTQAVEQSLQAESTEAPQGRLAGVAFVVGVNNMKRRRIRTTLTCVTVILVTFTMLSVISVGQDVEPTTVSTGRDAPYNGFLYARPGLAASDPIQIARLRAHYEDEAQVIARAWAQRLSEYGDYLGYEVVPQTPVPGADVQSLTAKVLVGMEPAEDGFVQKMPVVAGRWISSMSASEMLLSVKAAALLGLTPENFVGRRFTVAGRTVELVGLLDDAELAKTKDLSDIPLLPMLSMASQRAGGGTVSQADVAALEASGGTMFGPGLQLAEPQDVAFVSIGFARSLGTADFRTLSVKFDKTTAGLEPSAENLAVAAKRTWEAANHFIKYQSARIFVGLRDSVPVGEGERRVDPGQYAVASSSATQVGGVLKIAIPIILAATIILNTMLGSVMERRREVAIYNAIGLNPGHVMMFFLAESFVFGVVGSVAGYLIGQTLSLVVTRFIPTLNLNYSSLSVMVVIFLTIATVLLSTVYPAVMAARAAVPSGQRRWSLPQPDGDQIHIHFPFSYDAERVLGVCAYLRDYMRQNSEASTGKFLAKLGPVGHVPIAGGAKDERAYAMLFDIAPAPFDLGVNQTMEVYAYYDKQVKAHMLSVHLTRVSGETGNWVTVNQPFLESLRKRLLGWRSQKATTHEAFFREGEQLFAGAPDLPVTGQGTTSASRQERA